jgi:nematocidal protein AidA
MSKTINVQITIDTQAVAAISNPSQNPTAPTGIGHDLGYMVATNTSVISGQGTGDLNFKAQLGDTVRFFATSGSNNFDDAVLAYGMPPFQGPTVLGRFDSKAFKGRQAIYPSDGPEVLPGTMAPQTFFFYQTDVVGVGTEGYMVQFALYTRDDDGQLKVRGYYQWDPTITVKG